MTRELFVTYPGYHQASVKPQSYEAFCDMFDAAELGPQGIWQFKTTDKRTGATLREVWTKNIITDNGATAMLKNCWNSAGSTVAIFNQIAVAANAGSTTLTTAITSGATGVTSLAVQAVPAAIANGATLTLGYGTGTTQTVTVNGAVSVGATSITVNSFTASATFNIGSNVVPAALAADNPSSSTGAQYSGALAAGAFTFSGAGVGNRQVVITYTFVGGVATAGNYTEAFTCNANPIVAGSTATHLITAPMAINSSTNLTVTVTEKL